MRAIGAMFFLVFSIAGCRPDLDRAEGGIEIQAIDPPIGWERLRLELATRGRTHTIESILRTATIAVARVPAGQASLRLIAMAGESALAERSADIEVPDGDVLWLELGFGLAAEDAGIGDASDPIDAAAPELRSDPLSAIDDEIRTQDNVSGDRLAATAPFDGSELSAFVARAKSELGDPVFTVEEVIVTLQPFQQVATLDQLWDQTAIASLRNGSGTILIDVASGSLASSQTATLEANGADLERLEAALESGDLSASLVGHTSQSESDDFRARLTITIVLVAR